MPDPNDPLKGQCNDGDSVIFNGMLCSSGDDRGCDAVHRSQGGDGEFWRSPRKVGVVSKDELPFSDDHVLGAWAYIAHKKDHTAFRQWIDWIDTQPRPRSCPNDKCTFSVSDCPMLDMLALLLLESNKVCDPQHKVVKEADKLVLNAQKRFNDAVASLYKIPGADILRPAVEPMKASFNGGVKLAHEANAKVEDLRIRTETYARALSGTASMIVGVNALVNDPGPGQWDAAVEILLLKKYVGINAPGFSELAGTLTLRQPENPFFEYVAHGPTQRMLDQILDKCPAPENDPPHARFQWTWERVDDEQPPPFKKTMYWDCLTVANFYKDGPVYGRPSLTAPDLRNPLKQANAAADAASQNLNSLITAIEGLIAQCKKFDSKCTGAILAAPVKRVEAEAKHNLDQISRGEVPTPIGIPSVKLPDPTQPPKPPIQLPKFVPKPPVIKLPGGVKIGPPF